MEVTLAISTYAPPGDDGEARNLAVRETLTSWMQYLHYRDGGFRVHIADDGSEFPGHVDSLVRLLEGYWPVTTSRQERRGVGASINASFRQAYLTSPILFFCHDDWGLTKHCDVTTWVDLLEKDEHIGMIRLGVPHPNIRGWVKFYPGHGYALVLDRYGYTYAQRPALYHKRFTDYFGWWEEGESANECERMYLEKVNTLTGPDVILAFDYPWTHVESITLSALVPEGKKVDTHAVE